MKRVFMLLVIVMTTSLASAQNQTMFVTEMGEAIRSFPGGPLVGNLAKNARVQKLEQKEDFVKVSVEGWVRESALASGAGTGPVAESKPVLELVSYEIRKLSKQDTGDTARAQLVLRLRNTTSAPVTSWSGLLVVETKLVLFRSTVSASDKAVPPGAVEEFSFYWKEGEKEYADLVSYAPETLKVSLVKATGK